MIYKKMAERQSKNFLLPFFRFTIFVILWLVWKGIFWGEGQTDEAVKEYGKSSPRNLAEIFGPLLKLYRCDDSPGSFGSQNIEEVTEFSTELELDLETTKSSIVPLGNLLDDPLLRWDFENSVKGYLNSEYAEETGLFFHSLTIEENKERKRKRRANGKGKCKGKNCRRPPTVAIPKKNVALHYIMSNELISELHASNFESVSFSYILERKSLLSNEVSYFATFKQNVVFPWSSLTSIMVSSDSFTTRNTTLCKVSNEICEQQRYAITNVYDGLAVPYDPSYHECSWHGVSCDENNIITEVWIENYNSTEKPFPGECTKLINITKLILRNNALTGSIPTSIGFLKELTILSFENNRLSDRIPSEFGVLRKMIELKLNRNDFFGGIPSELGNAAELKILDISRNNNLGYSIPTEFGLLSNLRSLIIYNSGLREGIPASFFLLTKLEEILIGENQLTGDLVNLSGLKKLKILDVANNRFTGTIPESFKNLQDLEVLNLYRNLLTGDIPKIFDDLPLMTEFIAAKNNLIGYLSSNIGTMTELRILDLADNDLTSTLPTHLGHLGKVEVLNLHGNNFQMMIPSEIGLLSQIEQIVLSGNQITGSLPSEIGNLSSMRYLDIGNNLMQGSLPTTMNDLSLLEEVYIWGNDFTGNIGFLCDIPVFKYDFGVGFTPQNPCETSQKATVSELYSALRQPFYQRDPVCEWNGIVCNDYGAVVSINLAGKGLDGTISTRIGEVWNLRDLDLSNNKLTGNLPIVLSELQFLTDLNLSDNDITGEAKFLCNVPINVIVDVGEVRICETSYPSSLPNVNPSTVPSVQPSWHLSLYPSVEPSSHPSIEPTNKPSLHELSSPSPSFSLSTSPSEKPSYVTSLSPSTNPSLSNFPSSSPSTNPSLTPSNFPSSLPSTNPLLTPSNLPSTSSPPTTPLSWSKLGADIDGNEREFLGLAVTMSSDGNRILIGGKAKLNLHEWKNGPNWSLESYDFSSVITSETLPQSVSISMDGSSIVAGDPFAESGEFGGDYSAGSVSVFKNSGSGWQQVGSTLFGGASDNFGSSVDITGNTNTIVVGAPGGGSGVAYVKVFQLSGNSWSETHKLSNVLDYNSYGNSVSISSDGSRLVIGAPEEVTGNDGAEQGGTVYVKNLPSGSLLQRIDGDGYDEDFGTKVSMQSDGSGFAASALNAAYVMVFRFDSLSNTFKIVSDKIQAPYSIYYGHSLALSSDGSRMIVGAPKANSNRGKIFIYSVEEADLKAIGEIDGENVNDWFGYSVAISGDGKRIAAGAERNDGGGDQYDYAGHVRVYESSS